MDDSEHEQLIPNLRRFVAGEGAGLEIDSPDQWVLSGIVSPQKFFDALELILPSGSVLYAEGCDIRPWVVDIYERNAVTDITAVRRDTISPIPQMYHFSFSPGVIEELCEVTANREASELFDHIKAYKNRTLIFTFHDAFSGGELVINGDVDESKVAAFCNKTEGAYSKRPTQKLDLKKMKHLLAALENGGRAPQPFWKRVTNFLFGQR